MAPWRRNAAPLSVTPPIIFAGLPPGIRPIGRHKPGIAPVEPLGGEGAVVEDGVRVLRAQDLLRRLVTEICAGRHAGEAIAHGIVDALDLADMRIELEGGGAGAGDR